MLVSVRLYLYRYECVCVRRAPEALCIRAAVECFGFMTHRCFCSVLGNSVSRPCLRSVMYIYIYLKITKTLECVDWFEAHDKEPEVLLKCVEPRGGRETSGPCPCPPVSYTSL